MRLTASQIAQMNELLDEALPLDPEGRRRWLDGLSPEYQALAPALRAALLQVGADNDLAGLLEVGAGIYLEGIGSGPRPLELVGPYRLIRHPLYAAEILAACALVMDRPGLWATLTLVPFIAVQMLRARFEERLLSRIFPEYRRYAAQTPRLIPMVW